MSWSEIRILRRKLKFYPIISGNLIPGNWLNVTLLKKITNKIVHGNWLTVITKEKYFKEKITNYHKISENRKPENLSNVTLF